MTVFQLMGSNLVIDVLPEWPIGFWSQQALPLNGTLER